MLNLSFFKNSHSRVLRKIFFLAQNRIKPLYDSKNKVFVIPTIDRSIEKGVNVIGFTKYDVGLGEGARASARALDLVGVNVVAVNDNRSKHPMNNKQLDNLTQNSLKYNVNLFANNIDISFKSRKKLNVPDSDLLQLNGRYNINYGYWEFPKLPDSWVELSDRFDEIWAPTRFIADIFSRSVKTNVLYMPQAVDFTIKGNYSRKQFGLPENKFLFLFSFDLFSYDSRKNSKAVIEAFKRAFSRDEKNVCLVIKTNGSTESEFYQQRLEKVLAEIDIPPQQFININSNLLRDEMYGLISLCNCYISLHRAEGLGLGMAEAMKLGKPVIATNYSGNTDFMNYQNSCLVDYKLVVAKKEDYEFLNEDSLWAEPDIDQASFLINKIYKDESFRNDKAYHAKIYMDINYNLQTIGEIYKNRLKKLGLI